MSEPKPTYTSLPFYADAHEWDTDDEADADDPAIVFTRPHWTAPVFVGRPANALESIIAAVLRRLG